MATARRERNVVLVRLIAALVLLAAVDTRRVYAQESVPIFDGTGLKGWKVEHTKARLREGVLRVGKGNGWIRTERPFSDFVLTLDVRVGGGATGGVFVRAWPTFDRVSSPNNGYKVTIARDRPGDVATQPPGVPTSPGFTAWRRLEIECVGRTLVVRVDGSLVYTSETVENPQGHVALWASSGEVEFKAIAIKEYPAPSWEAPAGVRTQQDGVAFPRVRSEVKPMYTFEAMRARISGRVLLTAVVLPDGTVGEVLVRRSLDPKYGLDREAVAAARQWLFDPGTRDGQSVAVLVSIELAFSMK